MKRIALPCVWLLGWLLVGGFAADARADDWPQWMGPRRDGVWRAAGIVTSFPDGGLPIRWRAKVGLGFAGPAVAQGRVYVLDYVRASGELSNNPSTRDKLTGLERIRCLDARTGQQIWQHQYERDYALSYPAGPRCTPTVDGERVYALGAEGDLTCLHAETGAVVWSKRLPVEYGAATPIWGYAAHPLVVGDRLYTLAGGAGSVAVCLDKHSGKELWRALSATEPGYCPPTLIEHGGVAQLLIWHPEAVNSLDPATGKLYWSQPLAPHYKMSIMAPQLAGDYLFASGIGNIGALFKLSSNPPGAEVVWRSNTRLGVHAANVTPLIVGETIYGVDCHSGALIAARLSDGERLWQTFAPTTGERRADSGTAFLVRHEDRFFLFNERGQLVLARLTPERYEELGRQQILEPTQDVFGRRVVWSHPAFADRAMFARNDEELVCVELSAR